MYTHCFCLLQLRYISPLYRLPALPILPVNSFIFTVLPVNLKHGKSSTLVGRGRKQEKIAIMILIVFFKNSRAAKAMRGEREDNQKMNLQNFDDRRNLTNI